MKKKLRFMFSAIVLIVCLCSCDRSYDVSVNGGAIDITIPARTIGVGFINQVNYGSVNLKDVDSEVYHLFCGPLSCWGVSMTEYSYKVNLYYTSTDKYGNKKRGYVGKIGTLVKSEVKKYNSDYFDLPSKMIYKASSRYPRAYNENIPFSFPYHKYFGILAIIAIIICYKFSDTQ